MNSFNWGFFIDFSAGYINMPVDDNKSLYLWVRHLSFTQMICSETLIHLGMKQLAVFMNESVNYSLKQLVHKHFQSLRMTVPCQTKLCLGKKWISEVKIARVTVNIASMGMFTWQQHFRGLKMQTFENEFLSASDWKQYRYHLFELQKCEFVKNGDVIHKRIHVLWTGAVFLHQLLAWHA